MIRTIGMSAVFFVGAIALATWLLTPDHNDEIAVESPKSVASTTTSTPESESPSQQKVDPISIDRCADYLDGWLETLTADGKPTHETQTVLDAMPVRECAAAMKRWKVSLPDTRKPVEATEEEVDAMSFEEYADYVNSWIETLPSGIQSIIHKRQALQGTRWENLGYFDNEQKRAYASYDKDTLEALGDQGDLLALDILAQKYIKEDRNRTKATEVDLKAVVFGSAKAASSLAIRADSPSHAKNDESGRSHIYRAMAWYRVAAIMGDETAKGFGDSILRVRNIALSEYEWTLVNRQAEAIYAGINRKRRDMGLDALKPR